MLTVAEKKLYQQLKNNVDAYDHADGPPVAPMEVGKPSTRLGRAKGNPSTFTAQFDIEVLIQYFTVASGVYTATTAALIAPTLQTRLAFFLFGYSDFASGYANAKSGLPLSIWAYGDPFIVGRDVPRDAFSDLDSTALAGLQQGDLVIPITATVGATNYVALVILRTTQVAYATLLDAQSSDRFEINMIRYVISDTSLIAQFTNQINMNRLSLFGRTDRDFVSPNSFKMPEQFQNGIIDVPIKKRIDKQVTLASYLNYDATAISWSIFCQYVLKLE